MNKKIRIRIGIVVVIICVMYFSDWSFAADGSELDGLDIMGLSLVSIVSMLSWLWVLFAKLAGIFLTNSWVYGETLGLDILLWKYWNVVKNFANFGLGFYFVYVICRGLVMQGKEDVTKKLKDIILWLLVAGIGIQASWFVVGVVLDISTVTLVAAGSFPSQVVSDSTNVQESVKKFLDKYNNGGELINLFPTQERANSFINVREVGLTQPPNYQQLLDQFMPRPDDVSGPLYFIGFSILRTNVITSISSQEKGIKKTILNVIIQGGTTIVFAIEMLVLCVLALMRIVYLWIFIVLSPFAVLLRCIQKAEKKTSGNDKGIFSTFTSQINFGTFFINVFRPTIIVLGFGVSIIFVSLMNEVVNQDIKGGEFEFKAKGTTISSTKDPSGNGVEVGDETYTTQLDNNVLHFTLFHVGKPLLEVILSIVTVLIVYSIISFAVKMGKGNDIISKNIKGMQDGLGGVMQRTPIIPVTGYDKNGQKIITGLSWSGLSKFVDKKVNDVQYSLENATSKQTDKVMELWGLSDGKEITEEQKTGLKRAGAGKKGYDLLEAKKHYIDSIKTEDGMGMTLGSNAKDGGAWRGVFIEWLNNTKPGEVSDSGWKKIVTWWQGKSENERNLEKLFNNPEYANTYAEFFGYTGGNYSNFSSIKGLDVSKVNKKSGDGTPTVNAPNPVRSEATSNATSIATAEALATSNVPKRNMTSTTKTQATSVGTSTISVETTLPELTTTTSTVSPVVDVASSTNTGAVDDIQVDNWYDIKDKVDNDGNKYIEYKGKKYNEIKGGESGMGYRRIKDGRDGEMIIIGDYELGKLKGQGTSISWLGTYIGLFKEDKPDGRGKMTYTNGGVYEGDFKDSKREGRGIYYAPNGKRKYEGDYKNGKADGEGKYYFNNGRYEGKFKDGKITGEGIYYLYPETGARSPSRSDQYIGSVTINNKENMVYPNGEGIYTYEDGLIYKGKWVKGEKQDNNGKYEWPNGNYIQGYFLGNLLSGTLTMKNESAEEIYRVEGGDGEKIKIVSGKYNGRYFDLYKGELIEN